MQKLLVVVAVKADSGKLPCCSMQVLLQGLSHLRRGRLDDGLAIMPRVLPKQDARELDLLHKLAIALGLVRVLNFLWVEHSH